MLYAERSRDLDRDPQADEPGLCMGMRRGPLESCFSGKSVGAVGVAHDEAQPLELQQALQQRSLLAVPQAQHIQLLHLHTCTTESVRKVPLTPEMRGRMRGLI